MPGLMRRRIAEAEFHQSYGRQHGKSILSLLLAMLASRLPGQRLVTALA